MVAKPDHGQIRVDESGARFGKQSRAQLTSSVNERMSLISAAGRGPQLEDLEKVMAKAKSMDAQSTIHRLWAKAESETESSEGCIMQHGSTGSWSQSRIMLPKRSSRPLLARSSCNLILL